MKSFEKESLKYDLPSLKALQQKRNQNITLFEQSIKNERTASQQEEIVEATLENKIKMHNLGVVKLSDTDYHLVLLDLPKIKSTRERRNQTIILLKTAIIEEQNSMDYEERMIEFLEFHDSKK